MRFHVLGLGPIGSLFAHHLRRVLSPAHSITLIHKTERQAREAIALGGLIRIQTGGVTTTSKGFRSEIFEGHSDDSDSFDLPSIDSPPPDSTQSSLALEKDALIHDGLQTVKDKRSGAIDSLVISTKAHHTLSAVRRLLPRLSGDSTIVLLQNGLGVYEELVHEVFRNPQQRPNFILVSNTHGAYLRRFYDIVHSGVGELQFAIVPEPKGRNFELGFNDHTIPQLERQGRLADIALAGDADLARYRNLRDTVAAFLQLEPLHTTWRPMAQVQVAMRRKLVVNSVLNPLTAIMGCRNGDIFTTEAARRIMVRVCDEAANVYSAQARAETRNWLRTISTDESEIKDIPVGRIPRALSRPSLEEECVRVANLTKLNISSMLSDVRRGRKTEIEYFNGYLIGLGSLYGVKMPATAMLLNLVKMRSAIPLDQPV